jgi:2,6-dihydroxypyridine 3-monooxygenase
MTVRDKPRVVVVGGSLGGLTAALVLRDAGATVDVYERSPAPLHDLGAGIVLHPATVRYPLRHGLHDLNEISSPARRVRYLDRDGLIAQERPCRYRLTSYHTVYRLLLDAFGRPGYHLGRELVGFDRDADRVVARFAGGHTAACDLLVCADGIQSTGRRLLLPEVTPRYAGYVGWRGTVFDADRHDAFGSLREAITYFVMPHSHILVYPIPGTRGAPEPCGRCRWRPGRCSRVISGSCGTPLEGASRRIWPPWCPRQRSRSCRRCSTSRCHA